MARYHNIFGPEGTWEGGREKAPAAICRKVAYLPDSGGEIDVWGDGLQTRSFLYVDECLEATRRLIDSDFMGPVNIGSEEMVTINQLAETCIDASEKNLTIENLTGEKFEKKYGHPVPLGVMGRNSDNTLFRSNVGTIDYHTLATGIQKTYDWIKTQTGPKHG